MARSSSSSNRMKVMDETSFDQRWHLIGEGPFGQVWKTKHLQWGFNVAVKTLGRDKGLRSNEVIEKEAAIMLRVAEGPYNMRVIGVFRGVVPTIGAVMVGLVMEMMEGGSLASLQEKLDHLLPWPLVFRLAHQVALGMNYLHCLEPAIIHKDLKPHNVLLDAGLNVKEVCLSLIVPQLRYNDHTLSVLEITDFGLTKFLNEMTECRKNFGTVPFMPPEVRQVGPTYAYDVYSYALVLYSILHTGHGFPEFKCSANSTERPTLEYVNGMRASGLRVSGLRELVDLMVKCWDQTPDQRPTFEECIAVTERLYEMHKNEICDAVHKVQQELDGVILPEEETPSNLKELRDMMKEMNSELQLQKVKMAEMRVESRNEKDKMVGVERENAVLNHRLAAMEPKLAAMDLMLGRLWNKR